MGTRGGVTCSSSLFVLGLVAVSALVIVSKPTKLGLDLKGGVELVYQGQPTGQVTKVSGEDIERSIEIIRERIDELGVSEPEVSRLGTDQISVSLPDVTNAQRAIDQVGTTAQLYFYDWEPNLIGPERAIGGRPGQQPPEGPLKQSEKRWEDAGRERQKPRERAADLRRRLPERLRRGAARRRTGAGSRTARTARSRKPRFYLFEQKSPHELIAGPELVEEGPLRQPDRRKTIARRDRRRSPDGDDRRLRIPHATRPGKSTRPPSPAGTRSRTIRRCRAPTSPTRSRNSVNSTNRTSTSASPTTAAMPSRKSPARSPSAARRRRSARSAPNRRRRSPGHFAVVLDNEVKTRPIINFAENPDGIDGRTGAQISGGFRRRRPRLRTWRRPCRSAPCRSTSS